MTTTENAMKVGYIYKIVCLDPEITDTYVGSCQAFRTRKSNHKTKCNNPEYNHNVYQFIRANGGWANWSMLVIETVHYTIKHELLIRERFYIEFLRATLNKYIPTRGLQERYKAYYKNNKARIDENNKEHSKAYRDANKARISEYYKAYYENNKAYIIATRETRKQLVTCDCGKSSTMVGLTRHKKSKQHIQYEQIYNHIHS